MTATVQLFFNPVAGSYSQAAIDRLARAFERLGAQVRLTASHAGPPQVLAEASHVCIAGGDGTVRHVTMALLAAGCACPVAIYPAGTINLLAREGPGTGTASEFAARLLREEAERLHYPATIGETLFLACASVGPDSLVVASVSDPIKRRIGRLAYALAFLRLLLAWPRPRLRLTSEAGTHDCEAVFVARGRYYAGPWSFAPHACGTDGKLHVVALDTARRRDFARFVLDLLRGRDPALRGGVTGFSCAWLGIEGDASLPVQLDGDVAAHLPVRLDAMANPLRLR